MLEQLEDAGAWVNFNQGLDVRFLTKETAMQLNRIKTKMIHFAWDNWEEMTYHCLKRAREWLDKDGRSVRVYVLTNYNTNTSQDLKRIYAIRDIGFDPYVMIYDKPHAPKITRDIQRWCNSKWVYRSCPSFDDYNPTRQ